MHKDDEYLEDEAKDILRVKKGKEPKKKKEKRLDQINPENTGE